MSDSAVQESFSLTTKYQINVSKDDSDRVDSLRFSWEKLNALAVSRSELFVASTAVYLPCTAHASVVCLLESYYY